VAAIEVRKQGIATNPTMSELSPFSFLSFIFKKIFFLLWLFLFVFFIDVFYWFSLFVAPVFINKMVSVW
jgi:hypothetical protein